MIILKKSEIEKIFIALKSGQIVVFPTETSYGLGCDAANQKAVDKIFKIKKRPKSKPLLVVASSVAMAKEYLVWNKTIGKLAKQYWHDPLTIVASLSFRARRGIPFRLAAGVVSNNTLALRVTSHPLAKKLCAALGRPLVATSANIGGEGDIYNSSDIIKKFAGKKYAPDFLLDAGKLPRRKPSTIVSVKFEKIKIIRQGCVKISDKR
ncbi:threonylcarbamoyl-AMP synthase [Patescibacteria group bacterium]|nr:MAG: threonylcarbamoyl-AMP synthase [Patescibacteria group bacterium]